ncbi:MAG: hypothetical protein WB510_18920 [Candidatus Sulfotelmatobacter sp.]
MKSKRVAFAVFALAILFSIVREWNAPVVTCVQTLVWPSTSVQAGR